MFSHRLAVETVALLSKLDVDKHINIEIELDELDLTSAESEATYAQIKEYVWNKFKLKVPTLYIALDLTIQDKKRSRSPRAASSFFRKCPYTYCACYKRIIRVTSVKLIFD